MDHRIYANRVLIARFCDEYDRDSCLTLLRKDHPKCNLTKDLDEINPVSVIEEIIGSTPIAETWRLARLKVAREGILELEARIDSHKDALIEAGLND